MKLFLELCLRKPWDFSLPESRGFSDKKVWLQSIRKQKVNTTTYLLATGGGLTILGIGRGIGNEGGAVSSRWDFSSRNCMSRMRSSIRDRRKRRARRSISRVDAIYELSVTRKAEETWMSCITISGGIALASSSGMEGGDSSLIFIRDFLNLFLFWEEGEDDYTTDNKMKNAYWQPLECTQTSNASSCASSSTPN